MLGRQLVREIVYRVLCGEQGDALRALANRNDHFTQIARVLRYIGTDYAQPLTTNELAKRAGMSVSVFHQNFKLVTDTSPIQYIKQVLTKAATPARRQARLGMKANRSLGGSSNACSA
jgi:AraC-like DNA-binding protein